MSTLLPRLLPAVAAAFAGCGLAPPESRALRLHDARLVRYAAAEGRVELGCHRDGTILTVNIALNALSEYEGGGTRFEALSASASTSA
eukprot:CAMPEP_0197605134 /NCGR_PEP_ID=MMETSP1326-20131121/42537_1 /TAXON_ID=1155430 /ORGANISM="Genus nov. species nov., Strain RCC2288" /LENGTH=87 /DNA_ID=CAMNT_0043172885 /DNA_START=1 /DNA_END=260 /DNA_ORIENTATION=+